MPSYVLIVNGSEHRIEADGDMPLLWALRDLLRFTGTQVRMRYRSVWRVHCTWMASAVRSCQIPLSATLGKRYITIEGLSASGSHPCQVAWIEEDVSQCGYCQAGMIMETAALLASKPNPTEQDMNPASTDMSAAAVHSSVFAVPCIALRPRTGHDSHPAIVSEDRRTGSLRATAINRSCRLRQPRAQPSGGCLLTKCLHRHNAR